MRSTKSTYLFIQTFLSTGTEGWGLSFVKSFRNIIVNTLFSFDNALFSLYYNYCLSLSLLHGNKKILSPWFNVFIIVQLVFCVIGTYFCSDYNCHHVLADKIPRTLLYNEKSVFTSPVTSY
jgi:hypothetical protein